MKSILRGKLLDRRYRIIRTLAKGGFGETYIAEDTRLPGNPQCVVKHLKPSSSNAQLLENAKRLFLTEAETLQKLGKHDQIPQLLAYFEENREFYLVQELISGQTLSRELTPASCWSEERVCQLLWEILNILVFVHSHGVIHRDIKPDNILRRSQDQKLVLVDFGTVKQSLVASEQASTTIIAGTPGYMPTEQGRGKPRPSSDIYALGVIGIQALTGLPPSQFQEDSATGEIVWQSQATCSDALAAVLTKMVRYHFKERYASAEAARQELEPLIIGAGGDRSLAEPPRVEEAALGEDTEPSQETDSFPQFSPTVLSPAPKIPLPEAATVLSLLPSEHSLSSEHSLPSEHSAVEELPDIPVEAPSAKAPDAEEWTTGKTVVEAETISQPVPISFEPHQGPAETNSTVFSQRPAPPEQEDPVPTSKIPASSSRRFVLPRAGLLIGAGGIAAVGVAGVLYGLQRQQAYQQAHNVLAQAQSLKSNGRYAACIEQAKAVPDRYSDLQTQSQILLGDCLLAQAKVLAEKNQFKDAIAQANQVSSDMASYPQAQASVHQWSDKILQIATDRYRQGKLQEAEAIVKAIPAQSPLAQTAQQGLQQWQAEGKRNEALLREAQQALKKQQWRQALNTLGKVRILDQAVPQDGAYWKAKMQPIATQANREIEAAAARAAARAAAQRAAASVVSPTESGSSSGYSGSNYSNQPDFTSAPSQPASPASGGWIKKEY